MPTPEQKQAAHDENPAAFPFGQWFTGDNVNLSVGQGEMLSTPLQLANAYAAFSNGGTVFSPNIATKVLDSPAGEGRVARVEREIGPRVLRTVSLPAGARSDPGRPDRRSELPHGTAGPVFAGFPLGQYPIAGKTGTAQTAGKEAQFDTSLFVGFGPSARRSTSWRRYSSNQGSARKPRPRSSGGSSRASAASCRFLRCGPRLRSASPRRSW